MSTVPSLLDAPADGPMFDSGPLERPLGLVVGELVAARRDLERLRADRERATQLLADVDGTLARAKARVTVAEEAFEAYLQARVEGPLP